MTSAYSQDFIILSGHKVQSFKGHTLQLLRHCHGTGRRCSASTCFTA